MGALCNRFHNVFTNILLVFSLVRDRLGLYQLKTFSPTVVGKETNTCFETMQPLLFGKDYTGD